MQNIAILVGVPNSDCRNFDPLPACENDVFAMRELLEATHKFNKVTPLVGVTSRDLENYLKDIAEGSSNIGEIFVYFTGHGHSTKDDFYWVMRGFDSESPRSTGVSREALLSILRTVGASVTVIVQDACYSGQSLFKGLADQTLPALSNLIQFSSSIANEVTPSGQMLSPFTDYFIEAATTVKTEGLIDYLEITQRLNDLLEQNKLEPHLGYQGKTRQVFCEDASLLASVREKYLLPVDDNEEVAATGETDIRNTALATLSRASLQMTKRRDVKKLIDTVNSKVKDVILANDEILQTFELSTTSLDSYYEVAHEKELWQSMKQVPQWDQFVSLDHGREKVRQLKFMAFDSIYEPEYRDYYHVTLNADLENVYQVFYMNPKFEVLRQQKLEILFAPTIFETYAFSRLGVSGLKSWGSYSEDASMTSWSRDIVTEEKLGQYVQYVTDMLILACERSVRETVENVKKKFND